jgi:putative heme-binding domain-containing protein
MRSVTPCLFAFATTVFAQPSAAPPPGDAARGKAIFEGKGDCLSCHRVFGTGSRMGPDLSEMGIPRRTGGPGPAIETMAAGDAVALRRAIVDPDAEVAPANRFVRVVTKDGTTLTGRLMNHDNFTVQFIEASGKLRSFAKADLREFTLITKSQMPSYRGKLTDHEVADVVSYLLTLKGLQGNDQ